MTKAPPDLANELEEELSQIRTHNRELYAAVERKILNRMRIMGNEGQLNILEINEKHYANKNYKGEIVKESTFNINQLESDPNSEG